jgi:hypothetical protein
MSGSNTPAGATPEAMVRMWAIEGVLKSRKNKDEGVIQSTYDADNIVQAAAVLEAYVLNGAQVQAKA